MNPYQRAIRRVEDNLTKEMNAIIEQFRETFSGLYVKFKAVQTLAGNSQLPSFNLHSQHCNLNPAIEKSKFQNHTLSLYFLVPRKFIDPFRQVFRDIESRWNIRMLLSGPWPPFNFVCHSPGKKG